MKKVTIILSIIFCCLTYNIKANGAFLENGNYLEQHQWGALEDLFNDYKVKNITTDECGLYGCYILAAHEPNRKDNNAKAKLIPTKYDLEKKSVSAGPYFFINFLYQNENHFSIKVINEFKKSDWFDSDILTSLPKNNHVKKIILAAPIYKELVFKDVHYYRLFDDFIDILIDNNIVQPFFKTYIYTLALPGTNGMQKLTYYWPLISYFKELNVESGNYFYDKTNNYFNIANKNNIQKTIKSIKQRNIVNYYLNIRKDSYLRK